MNKKVIKRKIKIVPILLLLLIVFLIYLVFKIITGIKIQTSVYGNYYILCRKIILAYIKEEFK